MAPIPITIITGFLGSGKTTLILNLLPQLPKEYKVALLKNEFGDLAIDSKLASAQSISGVRELLNGCICCNLVGQLGDALETLRADVRPDRIIIETSGSAFPATLAMEVNRLGRETGNYVLDGVIVVIDVENWKGYEDTSYTAKLQAAYTDLIVFNKWELVSERCYDECLDRVGDLEVEVAHLKSDRGRVPCDVLLGLDSALVKQIDKEQTNGGIANGSSHGKQHHHHHDHQSEVDVLSVTLSFSTERSSNIDVHALDHFLRTAPKDEVYRIKAVFSSSAAPLLPDGKPVQEGVSGLPLQQYLLNWAFGRWTVTSSGHLADSAQTEILRMTIITARGEGMKWRNKIQTAQPFGQSSSHLLSVERVV